MTDLPSKLRELAESLRSCEWNHPLTSADTCDEAAKLIEVFVAVPDSCRDYEEVIRQLSGLPGTWYPAVLMHAVEEAYKANVFVSGGASKLIAAHEKKARL